MASGRFSRDDQVLEAIFNPENPVGGLEVSEHIQHSLARREWSGVIRFSVVSYSPLTLVKIISYL